MTRRENGLILWQSLSFGFQYKGNGLPCFLSHLSNLRLFSSPIIFFSVVTLFCNQSIFYRKKPKLSQWPYLWYTRFWTHALTKPISTSASADTLATWLHPSMCGMICFDVRSQSLVHSAMADPVTQTTGTSQSATAGGSVRLKTTFKSRQFLSTVIRAALVSLSWFSGLVTLTSNKIYRLLFHNWRSHWMESSVTKGQCFARKANNF